MGLAPVGPTGGASTRRQLTLALTKSSVVRVAARLAPND
jgi:hypothetical protein